MVVTELGMVILVRLVISANANLAMAVTELPQFLASALKGEAVWDQEESTLMLRIRDKEATQSAD